MNITLPAYIVLSFAAVTLAAWVHTIGRLLRGRRVFGSGVAPPVHWGWLRAVGVFLLFVMFQMLALVVYRGVMGPVEGPAAWAGFVIVMYAFNCLTLLAIYLNASEGGESSRALGLKSMPVGTAAWTGLLAFLLFMPVQMAYAALIQGILSGFTEKTLPMQEVVKAMINAGPLSLAVLVFSAAVLAPVFEELVFRGFVQGGLAKSLGSAPGIVVTVMLFTVVHGGSGAVLVFPVAVALGLLYHRTHSLAACIVFHAAVNGAGVIMVLFQRAYGA